MANERHIKVQREMQGNYRILLMGVVPFLLAIGSMLLAFSCGSPANIVNLDFIGELTYAQVEYRFIVGLGGAITPVLKPSVVSGSGSDSGSGSSEDTAVRYVLEKGDEGSTLSPKPTIGEDNGIIMIDPTTNVGTATFVVKALMAGGRVQTVTLTMIINERQLQVSTYYSDGDEVTDVFPVGLGQAIADNDVFSFDDDKAIVTITGLVPTNYTIHFGLVASKESYQKTASDGIIQLLKSELELNSFSFVDGASIGLSGPGIVDIGHIATYHPSNIYTRQDLQAMRVSLDRDYVLKKDIAFPLANVGATASNYKVVGDNNDPFIGSLDGSGYSITGVQTRSPESYQGLFGVMEAATADTVIVRDLVLNDFKIKGKAAVGSLSGWIKKGTVNNVRVEVSDTDAGKVEVSGSIVVTEIIDGGTTIRVKNYGYGGGLVGRAGTEAGITETQVRIQNTNSKAAVAGLTTSSRMIGGLVGHVGGDVMLTESFVTGAVTGSGDYTGGLVGQNTGIVSGYATGNVTGSSDYTGGLVGWSSGSVTGYATGDVTGNSSYIGGLVGWSSGSVVGYATGLATGDNYVGGLLGFRSGSSLSTVSGYARGIVRRRNGWKDDFGKTIGSDTGTSMTYSSMVESIIYDGVTGRSELGGTIGENGTAVTITDSTTQAVFLGFVFGTTSGGWTWIDNKWPAINIGDVKPAGEQPIGL